MRTTKYYDTQTGEGGALGPQRGVGARAEAGHLAHLPIASPPYFSALQPQAKLTKHGHSCPHSPHPCAGDPDLEGPGVPEALDPVP